MSEEQVKITEVKLHEDLVDALNEKTVLHFIDGEKGGVGKSTFASLLYEWYLDKEFPIKLIDADRSNPDVGLTYLKEEYEKYLNGDIEEQIFFAGDISLESNYGKADEIVNSVTEETGDILINLPASVGVYFNEWLEICLKESLIQKQYEDINNIYVLRWWVTDGSASSLDLLEETINSYPYLPYVLVLNNVNGMTAEQFSETRLGKKMLNNELPANISFIEIPKLSLIEKEMNYLKKNHISFNEATTSREVKVLTRQRIKTFVRKSHESISKILSVKMTLQEKEAQNIDPNV